MGLRLEPADEYPHPLGPEPNFNESVYLNTFDPHSGLGAWFRLGNRTNEGHAEMSVCLYLPDGRVGFMFVRPEIDRHDAFDAGGLHWRVEDPFHLGRLSYRGPLLILEDPGVMADPRRAFTTSPREDCIVELEVRGAGRDSMFGGEPDEAHERPGEEFARGHYEQLVVSTGSVTVGDRRFEIEGRGLRDHSWGPRSWQAPWYYRWLTANLGEDFGFMASRVAHRDGPGTRGGFVWEEGRLHVCDHTEIVTQYREADGCQARIEASLTSSRLGRTWRFRGEVVNLIPLRNRRRSPEGDELMTRIAEGMTRYTVVESGPVGRSGLGLSEYLDQIVDGMAVGRAE